MSFHVLTAGSRPPTRACVVCALRLQTAEWWVGSLWRKAAIEARQRGEFEVYVAGGLGGLRGCLVVGGGSGLLL